MEFSIEELNIILRALQEKLDRLERLKLDSEDKSNSDIVIPLNANYNEQLDKLKGTMAQVLAELFYIEN